MKKVNQNGYLILEPLSNIELYFTPPELVDPEGLILTGDEFKHAVKVMRNSVGDLIHVTDGEGNIYKSKISSIKKNELTAVVDEKLNYQNHAAKIWFCIPKLKNPDRFKFALEKSVELGITNFIVFDSKHTISKATNLKRWEKITLAAMKQSLRAYLPRIFISSLEEISKREGGFFLLDQNSENRFVFEKQLDRDNFFIFGPEGGLDSSELELFSSSVKYNLSDHRLRSETAIVKCASILRLC